MDLPEFLNKPHYRYIMLITMKFQDNGPKKGLSRSNYLFALGTTQSGSSEDDIKFKAGKEDNYEKLLPPLYEKGIIEKCISRDSIGHYLKKLVESGYLIEKDDRYFAPIKKMKELMPIEYLMKQTTEIIENGPENLIRLINHPLFKRYKKEVESAISFSSEEIEKYNRYPRSIFDWTESKSEMVRDKVFHPSFDGVLIGISSEMEGRMCEKDYFEYKHSLLEIIKNLEKINFIQNKYREKKSSRSELTLLAKTKLRKIVYLEI